MSPSAQSAATIEVSCHRHQTWHHTQPTRRFSSSSVESQATQQRAVLLKPMAWPPESFRHLCGSFCVSGNLHASLKMLYTSPVLTAHLQKTLDAYTQALYVPRLTYSWRSCEAFIYSLIKMVICNLQDMIVPIRFPQFLSFFLRGFIGVY